MEASSFNEANTVLDPPEGLSEQCNSLNVLRTNLTNGIPVVISCWKLTEEELEEVNKTGRVYLMVCGESMPPVNLFGKKSDWLEE